MHRALTGPADRALLLGAAALAALLVVLATLQYRWLGQLGEAEAVRLRAGARTRADTIARDFDREITLAFLWLRPDPVSHVGPDAQRYAKRWAGWAARSSHARMVQAVYFVETGRLARFTPERSAFEPAEWPAALAALRARLERPWPPSPDEPRRGRRPFEVVDETVPALVLPVPVFEPRAERATASGAFTMPRAAVAIVQLDGAYLRQRLLPGLVRRYAGEGADAEYTVRVRRRDGEGEIVFASDSSREAAADATAGLFGIRMEEGGDAPLATLPWREPDGPPQRGLLPLGVPFEHLAPAGSEHGHWRLALRHRAGSVDAVVASLRRRNLAVGALVLALLGASAVLIVVSARRARRLADRQLEFVAGVSHELRTPVAVVCAAGENLADGIVADPATAREYGRVLRDEGRRLQQMLEWVLELAGSNSGRRKWRRDEVQIAPLLLECRDAGQAAAGESGIAVDCETEGGLPTVVADRAALRRAILNLLQNACRHAGEGRFAALRARRGGVAKRPELLISVEDRGPGIPASEREHLFQPFFRGQAALARQVPGSGLGLHLVRRIVEGHEGRVLVETAPGRGSTFTIALPLDGWHVVRERQG